MMSRRLLACTIVVAGGVLMALMPSLSPAQSERPLSDVVGSTHVHGISVGRADPGRVLIATHHGLHSLDVDAGTTAPVSERSDDFMGFAAHPAEAGILYVSGHQMDISKADASVIYGVHGGLQASRDGGRTWRVLAAP